MKDISAVAAEPQPYKRSLLRQQRSHNTRSAILRAATRAFSEQDFDSTTVEDICAAAGVGRSTFYLYFDSKERLLIELARATARGVSSEVDAWVDAGSVDHALRVFIDGLVRRMEATPKSLATLVMRRVSAANVTPRPVPGNGVLFDDIFAGIVRDGQQRGEIRTDLDAREVGEALAGMTLDVLQRWAGGDQEQTLRHSLEFRLNLVLSAIRHTHTSTGAGTGSPGPSPIERFTEGAT
jgi:AcrR family transcriptional regulator